MCVLKIFSPYSGSLPTSRFVWVHTRCAHTLKYSLLTWLQTTNILLVNTYRSSFRFSHNRQTMVYTGHSPANESSGLLLISNHMISIFTTHVLLHVGAFVPTGRIPCLNNVVYFKCSNQCLIVLNLAINLNRNVCQFSILITTERLLN